MLNMVQKKVVDNVLRDFEFFGIGLLKEKQQCYGEIVICFFELGNQYSNNVFDVIMGWIKFVIDEVELVGMLESVLVAVKVQVEVKELEGYLLMLDILSYLLVMIYCDNQVLCEEMYCVYSICVFD